MSCYVKIMKFIVIFPLPGYSYLDWKNFSTVFSERMKMIKHQIDSPCPISRGARDSNLIPSTFLFKKKRV